MKLDKRVKEGRRPLTCFDLKEAEQFIGKKGYFSHGIDNYGCLENTVFGTLGSTEDGDHSSFVCTEETFDNYYYGFFLPAEWVKAKMTRKEYRPFTNEEFLKLFDLGKFHSIRIKRNPLERLVITCIYTEENFLYAKLNSSDTGYGPLYFFTYCEYFDGEWKPFGVLVEDEL